MRVYVQRWHKHTSAHFIPFMTTTKKKNKKTSAITKERNCKEVSRKKKRLKGNEELKIRYKDIIS